MVSCFRGVCVFVNCLFVCLVKVLWVYVIWSNGVTFRDGRTDDGRRTDGFMNGHIPPPTPPRPYTHTHETRERGTHSEGAVDLLPLEVRLGQNRQQRARLLHSHACVSVKAYRYGRVCEREEEAPITGGRVGFVVLYIHEDCTDRGAGGGRPPCGRRTGGRLFCCWFGQKNKDRTDLAI